MKPLPLVLSAGSVALLLGGCPSSPTNQPLTQETPAVAPSPQASPPPFTGATQPATRPPSVNAVIGLVPPTDPDQKRKQLDKDKGRVDPTSLFSITPEVEITVQKKAVLPPRRSRVAMRPSRSPVVFLPKPVAPAVAPLPVIPRTPAAPRTPPPPPTPTEALGVQVSGIVQLPSTPMAIVRAPGESTERRVIPGSMLSNNKVSVKSIDANPDNPSVTLEQDGQTVIRRLGEGMQATAADGTPASQSMIVYPVPAPGES